MSAEDVELHITLTIDGTDARALLERLGARLAGTAAGATMATDTSPNDLLSPTDAAELLRCKPRRIYDLRSCGRLPRDHEGGRAVNRRADIENLVS